MQEKSYMSFDENKSAEYYAQQGIELLEEELLALKSNLLKEAKKIFRRLLDGTEWALDDCRQRSVLLKDEYPDIYEERKQIREKHNRIKEKILLAKNAHDLASIEQSLKKATW
jgi:hypothetical protein